MIEDLQYEKDAAHFKAWIGNAKKLPDAEYAWHAACAYGRRTWRDAAASIAKQLPHGCFVHVDAPTFHGVGFVDRRDYQGPHDEVPVHIINGNVWWYHSAHCRRITDLKSVEPRIRKLRLLIAGIKTL